MPIILRLCQYALMAYYSKNYASILGSPLHVYTYMYTLYMYIRLPSQLIMLCLVNPLRTCKKGNSSSLCACVYSTCAMRTSVHTYTYILATKGRLKISCAVSLGSYRVLRIFCGVAIKFFDSPPSINKDYLSDG